METLYKSEVISEGGINGRVASKGGELDVHTFAPSGARNSKSEKTNPEQLFAASYASCFNATMHHIAEAKQIDINDAKVKAIVEALQVSKGDLEFALEIEVDLPGIDKQEAQSLLEEAYRNCPISKATDGNMKVDVKLTNTYD